MHADASPVLAGGTRVSVMMTLCIHMFLALSKSSMPLRLAEAQFGGGWGGGQQVDPDKAGIDFYAALGVAKGADATQLKRAYRKLAVQFHPDKNKAPDAQKRFVEISRAYEVLSDPRKRELYDRFGSAGPNGDGSFTDDPNGGFGGGGGGGFGFHDPMDLFAQFFGGGDGGDGFFGGGGNPFGGGDFIVQENPDGSQTFMSFGGGDSPHAQAGAGPAGGGGGGFFDPFGGGGMGGMGFGGFEGAAPDGFGSFFEQHGHGFPQQDEQVQEQPYTPDDLDIYMLGHLESRGRGRKGKRPSSDGDVHDWEETVDASDMWLIQFYAPWCSHCHQMAPAFKKAAKQVAGFAKFGAVDCTSPSGQPLCAQFGIEGYPTVVFMDINKHMQPVEYEGPRSAKGMVDFIMKRLPNKVKLLGAGDVADSTAFLRKTLFPPDGSGRPVCLLFTAKPQPSSLFKGLAVMYSDHIVFAQTDVQNAQLRKHLGVSGSDRTLVLISPDDAARGMTVKTYKGEVAKDPLILFLDAAVALEDETE